MKRKRWLAVVWLGLAVGVGLSGMAGTLYVAPNGTSTGDGSAERPLDLLTAISSNSPARPGDTLMLLGGRYDGPVEAGRRLPFVVGVSGAPDRPIIITPAPDEWAHLNGGIHIEEAGDLHMIRLDIGPNSPDPVGIIARDLTVFNLVRGERIKLINCNLFGGGRGLCLWAPGVDFEAYGNLIHDVGDPATSLGRAFYMQNDQGTKTIMRNIAWRSTDWLYGMYTQQGHINGFDLIENIGFMAGYHKPGESSYGISLIGFQPAERIRIVGNILYQYRDNQDWRGNARMIVLHKPEPVHRDAVFTDNVVMGGYRALILGRWERVTVTGNTFWATAYLNEINSAPTGSNIPPQETHPDLSGYHVDGNTYVANGNERPFIYGRAEVTREEDRLSFDDWQALGLDVNGALEPGRDGRPTGARVFVFNNRYAQGRGQVAVFNWDGHACVEADLSPILNPGQRYRLYNCQDIHETISAARPVIEGVFDGAPLCLPMRRAEEAPYFDAFLVLGDLS